VTSVADKKAAEKRPKKKKDQSDKDREQRAPSPVKKGPRTYRFDDWASI
jgi:hypothetical protein